MSKTFETEYKYIKNDGYKENIKILVSLLPEYFFEVAASSTGKYHPSFSLGDGGLLRHTKAAVKIAHDLMENETIGKAFTSDEKDLIIISLIMHDGLKHGHQKSEYTVFEHPILVADYIKENKNKTSLNDDEINFIYDAISSHMGQWNTNQYSKIVLPLPKTKYQRFVHMCDYMSSRKYLDIEFQDNEIIE